jgi:hypothetical protein
VSTSPATQPTDTTSAASPAAALDLEPPAGWNGFTHPTVSGEHSDAWRCPCGNQPHTGGFYTVDLQAPEAPDATVEVDPCLGGRWDGRHYGCATCGRVADFTLLGSPVVRGPRPFIALP